MGSVCSSCCSVDSANRRNRRCTTTANIKRKSNLFTLRAVVGGIKAASPAVAASTMEVCETATSAPLPAASGQLPTGLVYRKDSILAALPEEDVTQFLSQVHHSCDNPLLPPPRSLVHEAVPLTVLRSSSPSVILSIFAADIPCSPVVSIGAGIVRLMPIVDDLDPCHPFPPLQHPHDTHLLRHRKEQVVSATSVLSSMPSSAHVYAGSGASSTQELPQLSTHSTELQMRVSAASSDDADG